ncbi:hypothetical protein L596_023059 [Steinernema carpocapsae]|uniref:Uncharacterized protein n=1 Tax=Steinernema carpocapsae TaxID=34508 RepID=A0A4U5MDB7_STECR|nr:hypothetical protein L596_023059 [Steinernema carpocapsae]
MSPVMKKACDVRLPLAAFAQRTLRPLRHQEAPREKQPTTPEVYEALHPVTTLRPQAATHDDDVCSAPRRFPKDSAAANPATVSRSHRFFVRPAAPHWLCVRCCSHICVCIFICCVGDKSCYLFCP